MTDTAIRLAILGAYVGGVLFGILAGFVRWGMRRA